MNPVEIEKALETFRIIVDTREQITQRSKHRYKAFGVPYERGTLRYGDYSANITFNNNQLYDLSKPVFSACVVERKMSLDELAICFTSGRERFEREFQRATDNGAKVYLLVENASWEKIQRHEYKSRFNEKAFQASLLAWAIRYDLSIIFCQSMTSGGLIKEILYRDMKERLGRGELDGKL